MALLYIIKPESIYDNKRKEFKQFGTEDGKTLLPLYIVGILLAIILYVLFNKIAKIYTGPLDNDINYNMQYLETEKDPELLSLKNQVMMMNQTITQMNQMNQINQMNQLSQMNQLNQMNQLSQLNQMNQLKINKNNYTPKLSESKYDKYGIHNSKYSNDGSIRSIRSAGSVDAGSIIDSVLASVKPSDSYNYDKSNRAILPNNFSI
jgi:hypothetical protein